MKNLKYKSDNGRGVTLALTVTGAVSGQIVLIGNAGLFGIAETDTVTQALIDAGKRPQGLKVGEASVNLPGIGQLIAPLTALPAGNDGDKVYRDASTGNLTATATANLFVGWRLKGFLAVRNNG